MTNFLIICLALISLSNAYAAEIQYKDVRQDLNGVDIPCLTIEGKIEYGDYRKLQNLINQNPELFAIAGAHIALDSNGGDFVEALKIGALIKSMPTWIMVQNKCASSCFFLYVAGAFRHTGLAGQLGVHRPFFDARYFRKLNTRQAEIQQKKLFHEASKYLEDSSVPNSLQEVVFNTPSTYVKWLNPDQTRLLGMMSPSFWELALARCQLKDVSEIKSQTEHTEWIIKLRDCSNKLMDDERQRVISEAIEASKRNKSSVAIELLSAR